MTRSLLLIALCTPLFAACANGPGEPGSPQPAASQRQASAQPANGGADFTQKRAWQLASAPNNRYADCLGLGHIQGQPPILLWGQAQLSYECSALFVEDWWIEPTANGYRIHPWGGDGFCWDVPNAVAAEGAPVNVYQCNGGKNQLWDLWTRSDGSTQIVSKLTIRDGSGDHWFGVTWQGNDTDNPGLFLTDTSVNSALSYFIQPAN